MKINYSLFKVLVIICPARSTSVLYVRLLVFFRFSLLRDTPFCRQFSYVFIYRSIHLRKRAVLLWLVFSKRTHPFIFTAMVFLL